MPAVSAGMSLEDTSMQGDREVLQLHGQLGMEGGDQPALFYVAI